VSAESEIVIEVKDLKAGYGERAILEHVNFTVREGEIVAVIGRSGSGKSTLLKHLIGLYPPLAGEVRILGEDIVAARGEDRRRILRRFGVLYQSGALFGSMSVLENVRLPLEEFTDLPQIGRDLVALSKLKLVGLAAAAESMPAELSGGMQKRAALARAMALDPRILFLDEPSVGLDPITSSGLDDLIKDLSSYFGITFFIITHELASIFAIAHRAIMLDEHRRTVIAEGPPADLRDHSTDPVVKQFFCRRAEAGSTMSQTPAP
jgi:phospholipid/cholesterol/gamma-HCH transport system ATP-binding protein